MSPNTELPLPGPEKYAEAEVRTYRTRARRLWRDRENREEESEEFRDRCAAEAASGHEGEGERSSGGGARGRCACACAWREATVQARSKRRDGGRECTRRRTVADEVRHESCGALRFVPPVYAGAGGRAELPALGAAVLHAGGLRPQGGLPAARELLQQQAQRPQRVLCQVGLGLDLRSPPALHRPHQLSPDGQGCPGPATPVHPARGHGHLVRVHGHLLQRGALHGQLLPVARPGGHQEGAPEQAAVPGRRRLLARLRHLGPLLPADLLCPHDCGGDGRAARGEDGPKPPPPHHHHRPGRRPGPADLHLVVDVSLHYRLLPQLVPESVRHRVRPAGLVRDVQMLVSESFFPRTASPGLQFASEARQLQEIKEKPKE